MPGALLAQLSPNGSDFQVNTYVTGNQQASAIAIDGAGRFVVAWESFGSGGSDHDSYSIHARRYDAAGRSLGTAFQVNSSTTSDQGVADVAADGSGRFVVVWTSMASAGGDTDASSIQAQRYDAAGNPLGAEFQVNTYTPGYQAFPSVAAHELGGFVVAWQSQGSPGADASGYSVQARRYGADGAPLGSQFQVNTYGTNNQQYPAVAIDGSGRFVIAWESLGSAGSDQSSYSVHARRYDAGGVPLGGEFQVNTTTTDQQGIPEIAADSDGRFEVVWFSLASAGSDNDQTSVQMQRYDAAGVPLGGELQVNVSTTGYQAFPAIAADDRGHFVVAWASEASGGTDLGSFSIQARRFERDGAPYGGEFQVNSWTTGNQYYPSVAVDRGGNFVVTWTSATSGGGDASGYSVQARRFDDLFRDGFETGGTARWSLATP
ncbi:MAG: hypothetical protein F9K18_02100 [Thermoanaerobaculia bacterium]|nr:MAG: hypothetical protein F9K18_02100 [Thermoanaerobaculia bacterium]